MLDNVVPFRKPDKTKNKNESTSESETLEQIAEKNRLNQERLRKERLADTKKVLRSYRIKGDK